MSIKFYYYPNKIKVDGRSLQFSLCLYLLLYEKDYQVAIINFVYNRGC